MANGIRTASNPSCAQANGAVGGKNSGAMRRVAHVSACPIRSLRGSDRSNAAKGFTPSVHLYISRAPRINLFGCAWARAFGTSVASASTVAIGPVTFTFACVDLYSSTNASTAFAAATLDAVSATRVIPTLCTSCKYIVVAAKAPSHSLLF
jgi:hypothetical protein